MMKISEQLFESKDICLAPINHELDADIESKWTQDTEYQRLISIKPARPLSPAQLKKKYEAIEKEQDEKKNMMYFTIRMRDDDRLIGFAKLYWIEWANGTGLLELGIGDSRDRNHGYGTQALHLLLRYVFAELNLHRLTAFVPEYNPVAMHIFEKAGFAEEVRRRQALNRDGRRWDLAHMGILSDEWATKTATEG